jgi:16S rRNA (guanine966-N2)-methyltransferase
VRPTADRVREALFNILGPGLIGARVLDAYAGSGALGFEALSRGASRATLVEADGRALATMRESAVRLGLEGRVVLCHGRVLELLGRGAIAGPFDLILADPPYDTPERGPFLDLARRLLAQDGRLVLERDRGQEAAASPALERLRTARYGRTCLDFYGVRRAPDGAC